MNTISLLFEVSKSGRSGDGGRCRNIYFGQVLSQLFALSRFTA